MSQLRPRRPCGCKYCRVQTCSVQHLKLVTIRDVTQGIVHCLQASPPEGLFKPGGRGAVAQMLKRKQELQRQRQQRQHAQQAPQPQAPLPSQAQNIPAAEATRLRGLLQQELGLQVLSSALPWPFQA